LNYNIQQLPKQFSVIIPNLHQKRVGHSVIDAIATEQLNQRIVHRGSVGVTDLAIRPQEKLDAELRAVNEIHHLNNQRLAQLTSELPQEILGFGAKPGSDCVGH